MPGDALEGVVGAALGLGGMFILRDDFAGFVYDSELYVSAADIDSQVMIGHCLLRGSSSGEIT